MGGLDDWWGASRNWHKQVWEGIEDDPWRLLTGFDPLNTMISNTILNRDDEPLGDWLGGPTSDMLDDPRYSRGEKKSANDMKVIIPAIVGTILTGGALAGGAGAAGGGGAAGGAAAGGGTGAAASGTALGSTAGTGAGATLGNTAGLLSGGAGTFPGSFAIPSSSAVGLGNTAGVLGVGGAGGAGAAGAGAGGAAAGSGGIFGEGGMFDFGSMDWSDPNTYVNMMQNMPQGGGMGGRSQEPQAQAPPPIFGPGGYVPDMEMAMRRQTPPRYTPFGLLNTPEEQEMMKQALGGLL